MSWDTSTAGLGLRANYSSTGDHWTESGTATFPGVSHPAPDQEFDMDGHTLDPTIGVSGGHDYYAILLQVSAATGPQTPDFAISGYFTEFTADGPGGPLELANASDGSAVDPFAVPAHCSVDAYVMRPTALSWPGQDPANAANRIIWSPSDVIPQIDVHLHVVVPDPHPTAILTEFAGYEGQVYSALRYYEYDPSAPSSAPFMCVL